MYELTDYEILRPHQQNRRDVTMEQQIQVATEDRETRLYVVRDLSWELARYLDAEDSSASLFASSH